ncbi:MAG: glycosyltransferase [Ignavibacteriaceae bacterium]|nr:glycosyltransferase [Ignavibacteriaceae bacterium]
MTTATRKKILIIGPAFPYRGGNSLFVSYVYDSLKDNFEVVIFNYKLLYPSLLFPGTTQFDNSGTTIKKAPNRRVVNSINPFNWISVASKIVKENPDLIVFDWWHPFFGLCHFGISAMLPSKLKKKIIFITENYISHEGNFIDRFLTKIGLVNSKAFVALSDVVEQELISNNPDKKIFRSELPVYDCYKFDDGLLEQTRLKLGYTNSDKILLFFGYVRKYKGLDILIDAMPEILTNHAETKLLIVGEFYDDPSEYITQIKSLGIQDKVKIINRFVPNEEVGEYYLASDLVVLPYRSATQSGILNVAYGLLKPVLVTNVGGLSEFMIDNKTGILVKPNSSAEIAKGVQKFFELNSSVNFEENIRTYICSNKFEKLPKLFEEILSDIK